MSIGEALAEARHRAGLSVAQVSQRTRIREAIICDIETDDYSGCGGDFYVRGHIRGIAKVTGADPGPLIGEYDTARRVPPTLTLADIFPDTPATPAAPGKARGRRQPTPVLALASLAALVMALGFVVSGLPSGSRHAAAAAPQAPAHQAIRSLPRPAWRASATVPAHPPAPVSIAAAGRSDGRGSTPQAGAAAARPRNAP